jgi:hypothetical protein
MEQGGAFADTKHYLYGLQCIGEQADADDLEKAEWRYYHRDGQPLVRQTSNSDGAITFAWAYSPEDAVLLGEKGPVTNLDCGAIYDWNTGLTTHGALSRTAAAVSGHSVGSMTSSHTGYTRANPAQTISKRDVQLVTAFSMAVLFFFGLLLFYLLVFSGPQGVAAQEVVDATAVPVQQDLPTAEPIILGSRGYTWRMYPRAEYRIAARVIGSKSYWDWQSQFAPLDLALGWGQMSDPAVDEWITWRQASRAYRYRWAGQLPFEKSYIRDHSANVHIIPATDNLNLAIKRLRPGDLVLLEGLLVDIEGGKGANTQLVRTSLTRADSGAGACEILYVERLVIGQREYR